MSALLRRIICLLILLYPASLCAELEIHPGQRIAIVGNSTGERMNLFGHFETQLHLRFPKHEVSFRNFAWPADEVALQQRPNNYTTIDDPLDVYGPDLFICFFGFNEFFSGNDQESIDNFAADYRSLVNRLTERFTKSEKKPRFVLVSPIAFESTGDPLHPDANTRNEQIVEFAAATERLAQTDGHTFVDGFHPSLTKFRAARGNQFTVNGFHMNEAGYRELASWMCDALFGPAEIATEGALYEKLRAAVNDKSWHHLQDYRMLNGWYVYGGRRTWDKETFPGEFKKIRNMVAVRDRYVWDIAQGENVPDKPDDSETGDVFIPETMFGTRDENFRHGREPEDLVFPTPQESISQMRVPDGLKVELFADEETFPELVNPCQIEFDNKGRLWVSCMENYPQWQPDLDKPDDRLLIFEDTNNDGKADKCITFYDKLACPTGFEFYDGGVLVVDQPRILFLKDTDGDDRADLVVRVMDGLATGDTHHSMGAWEVSHDGLIYMLEGISVSTTLETAYGPLRNNGPSGAYVWDPRTGRVRHFRTPGHGNPWCMLFDEWGSGIIGDGTGAAQHWATPLSGGAVTSRSTMKTIFDNEGMRPVVGSEFLRSRHLPDEIHNHFIYACVINMHGLTRFNVRDDTESAGFTGERIEDLLDSTDMMFRPIDPHIGPDGAIWFGDWCNPLIGHMQYSQRDPNRDHDHGRIYRLVNTKRELLEPETQHGKSLEALLAQLSAYELRTRCRARRELRARDAKNVVPAVDAWLKENQSPLALCEALWLKASFREFDRVLLDRILNSEDFHARAAAINVVGNFHRLIPNAQAVLFNAIHDEHARVRVEAVRALSFFNNADAARMALRVTEHPMDYWIAYTLDQTLNALRRQLREPDKLLNGEPSASREYLNDYIARKLPGGKIVKPLAIALDEDATTQSRAKAIDEIAAVHGGSVGRGKTIYKRVCATCHIIGNMGRNFGPDLDDIGARFSRRQILDSIVHPNAEIAEGYKTVTVATEDGEVVNGFIVNETEELLTLRVQSGEKRQFQVSDIEERSERKSSSMPEGLAGTIGPGELLDLIKFLQVQRASKDGYFPASQSQPPRTRGALRELSYDAMIKLGPNFPPRYNMDADRFLAPECNKSYDFSVHSPEPSKEAFVIVRLKEPAEIHEIEIVNRPSHKERADSLAVWVSSDESNWQRVWQAESVEPSWEIKLSAPVKARYIRVGLQAQGILNLDRMAVFGK